MVFIWLYNILKILPKTKPIIYLVGYDNQIRSDQPLTLFPLALPGVMPAPALHNLNYH